MDKNTQYLIQIEPEQLRDIINKEIRLIISELKEKEKTKNVVLQELNIKEASDLIGLSVKTIYKKTHLKQIPYYKIPGSSKIFFKRDELISWLEAGRKKTKSEIESEVDDVIIVRKRLSK